LPLTSEFGILLDNSMHGQAESVLLSDGKISTEYTSFSNDSCWLPKLFP